MNQIKTLFGILFLSISLFIGMLSPHAVFAKEKTLSDEITGQYQKGAAAANLGKVDPRVGIAGIIQIILTTIGTIFMGLTVLAGYWIFTAEGDEDKVEKAKKTIKGAVIGLAITLAAYGITSFVGTSVDKAANDSFQKENQGSDWKNL